ncbi:hypothetical protein Q1695_002370 [Nippostrongylus brasiliensis]|nr:hypothetical protein Q1695_002370 [Nippostrongylus brasiliensis]
MLTRRAYNRLKWVSLGVLFVVSTVFYIKISPKYNFILRDSEKQRRIDQPPPIFDIFDVCPFEYSNPWNNSLGHPQVKECKPNRAYVPITELVDNRVEFVNSSAEIKCFARCIEFYGDNSYLMSEWKATEENEFTCDFVETNCTVNGTSQTMLHQQLVEQPVEKQLDPAKHPDVHVFILDSVSSGQVIRALPRTVNFFMNAFNAVQFRKLNRIGRESRSNAFPLFLGAVIEDVERTIVDRPSIPSDYDYSEHCKQYLDGKNYTPMEYTKFGYMTLMVEDYELTAMTWPDCLGFLRKQTHHNYRPFYTRFHQTYAHLEKELCLPTHKLQLQYLSRFWNSYKGKPKFSLAWLTDLAHDDAADLYSRDNDLYDFFKDHHHLVSLSFFSYYIVDGSVQIRDSFIFFMGDHGLRFGQEAKTPMGQTEVNNPFLYVALPNRLIDSEIYKQLVENSRELVTHFDLHATFSDILYEQPSTNFTSTTFMRFDDKGRGSSLLRKFEEGVMRNCKNLPIPSTYCLCKYERKNVTDRRLIVKLGIRSAEYANGILKSHNQTTNKICHPIKAAKGSVIVHQYALKGKDSSVVMKENVYDVRFRAAKPARGLFKVVLRLRKNGKIEFGQIPERLDKYGNDGLCSEYYDLRSLCTCVNK